MTDVVEQAVKILNEALERDPEAVVQLMNLRVPCNERLAGHSAIQANRATDGYRLGILGLLNGILSGGTTGAIGAQGTVETDSGRFRRINRFVDLRTDNLDVLA